MNERTLEGGRVRAVDTASGRRYLRREESDAEIRLQAAALQAAADARQAAEDEARRQAAARQAAEEELVRLKAELARLKGES